MKPRIKLSSIGPFKRVWMCSGSGAIAFAGSPRFAFMQWKVNLEFTKRITAIINKTGETP